MEKHLATTRMLWAVEIRFCPEYSPFDIYCCVPNGRGNYFSGRLFKMLPNPALFEILVLRQRRMFPLMFGLMTPSLSAIRIS